MKDIAMAEKADKGAQTRERILAAAQPLVLRRGFAGTSLDDILGAAELTKGAFFHHFKDKGDFARALVERFAANDLMMFEQYAANAEAASSDPYDQAILFLKAAEDFIENLSEPLPGCMLAVYTYEAMQFEPSIQATVTQTFRKWSRFYEKRFEAVLARYTPAKPVTARDLAETVMSVFEGGIILALSYNDGVLLARSLRQFRQYFELLFADRARKMNISAESASA
jgi:TetR/AcrR family transcriptional repressor of nem operon